MSDNILLEARHVTKIFSSGGIIGSRKRITVALDDASLAVRSDPPAIITIAGESGSGKTTLSRLLLGLIRPTKGEIYYRGKPLTQMKGDEWMGFRRQVQAIFQDPFEVYNPFYKVDHMLQVPIRKFGLAKSPAEERALIEKALTDVGLRPDETLGRYPHQLSGGQRQRITVARAVLLQPKLLIADEPVSMVDASLRATILQSLRALNKEMGVSVLYITHDLATAYHIAEDIVVFYQGSVAEAGAVDQIILEPQHPYTQLLVGSIPWPDPNRPWGREPVEFRGELLSRQARGCKFASRCSRAMDICREQFPPLYRTGNLRAVACYLYQDQPVLEGGDLSQVLGKQG